jgi:hypothetical protein
MSEDGGIDKVLSGTEVVIQIKESAKRKPVFLKAKARGLALTEEPMSSDALGELPADPSVDILKPEYGFLELPFGVFGQVVDVFQAQNRILAQLVVECRKQLFAYVS